MNDATANPVSSAEQHRFPCGQCGAKLEFTPGTTSLKCPYCSFENAIDTGAAVVEEQDFTEHLRLLEAKAEHVEVPTVRCDACAAEVAVPANVTSFSCSFCASNIVAQARMCSVIRPKAILPFHITRERAVELFRKWLTSLWFAPGAIKKQSTLDSGVTGVYIPAWTYDSFVATRYRGQRGDAYYVPVTMTINGKRTTRMERRIRWSSVSGHVNNRFDDVLVLASNSLPADKVRKLEPWDLKAVVPFATDYLAGFRAERYQVELGQGFEVAKGIMAPTIDTTIRGDIGGDEQRIESKQSTYSEVTFKHLLLPVWISAYRYRGKVYQFLVNARTGEVQGARPYSALKIALAVVGALIVIGAVALIFASSK